MLELGLEQPDHLDGGTCRACDRDCREPVGRKHLFHRTVGDEVAFGRAPVSRHNHSVRVAERDDRRPVTEVPGWLALHALEMTLRQIQTPQQFREARSGIV